MPTELWGNATWLFFHVLVEKVNENKFNQMKSLVIEIIKDTCKHLPCPYCAEDASKVLNQAYIQNIKNKEHLIEFLRQFHNIINTKLNNKTYTIDEAVKKEYSNYNLSSIINNLFKIYNMKYGLMKMMTYNAQRKEYLKRLQINLNKYYTLNSE